MQSYKTTHPGRSGVFYAVIALAALALSYLLLSSLGQNASGVYGPRLLVWIAILAPLLFAALLAVQRLLQARLEGLPRRELLALLALSLVPAALLAWQLPPPTPVLLHSHSLALTSRAERNPEARDAKIEIKELRASDGSIIPLENLRLTGDWRLTANGLVSDGSQPGSTAELSGALTDQIAVLFNYRPQNGQILVFWDGSPTPVDLYWKWPVDGALSFGTSTWQAASGGERFLLIAGALLYTLGLAGLLFGLALVFRLRLLPAWLEGALLGLVYLAVWLLYVRFKSAYAGFNAERVYGDTISYVLTAERSLGDFHFWFSDRSFSLPLLYKAAGMTSANFNDQAVMQHVGDYQMWLSVAGWTVLALAVAGSLRQRWLAPLAFTTILFFSLSLEVSLWDRLMYSEALSYALLAALLGLWIWLETLPLPWQRGLPRALHLLALAVVTILYSFTRDTNLYFLLVAAGLGAASALLKRSSAHNRAFYLAYAAAILGLFVFQNLTIRLGDRWQVHVYDNLVRRALLDEEMLAYFVEKGLPVSQKLLALKDQGVAEYQGALFFGQQPEFAAVREWVQQSGQSAYIRYMLDHPERSLGDPLRNFDMLINGNNAEYRYPAFPGQPVPADVGARDARLYARSPAVLLGILLLVSAGCLAYWLGKGQAHPAWLVLSALLVSIPLLSFMVWNGNPLEIERHAIQIGAQFRLAGWIALLLVLDCAVASVIRRASAQAEPIP